MSRKFSSPTTSHKRRRPLVKPALILVAMSLSVAAAGGPITYPGMPAMSSECLSDYDKYLDRYVEGGESTLEGRVDVPVLVVHGWTGSADQLEEEVSITAWDQDVPASDQAAGSILKRLADIPRASVFTFNYEEFSARWVESNEQGPAMAGVIDCLFQASGHPVNIVAHSMGGLIVRQALKETPEREKKIGQVVTIGTPNTGSDIAAGVAGIGKFVLWSHPQAYPFVLALDAMTRECGVEKVNDEGLSSACPSIKMITAFRAEGGIGLRSGSEEIKRLPEWPASVNVRAIAGDYVINTKVRVGMFTKNVAVSLGDFVVSAESALDGADSSRTVTCDVTLEAGLGVISTFTALNNNRKALDGKSLLACSHTGLLTHLTVVNDTIGTIQTSIEADTAHNILDLSGYQITQDTLEPITPDDSLLSIETLRTDRQAMVGAAKTALDDPQTGAGAADNCTVGPWCPAFSDALTAGRPGLFVKYRALDGVSSFDQVEGFLVLYPTSTANSAALPRTDRGIGGGATKPEVKSAYADMFVWEWYAQTDLFPPNPDGRANVSGLSVLLDECGLNPLTFTFDENDLLTSIGTGTAWDNCVE